MQMHIKIFTLIGLFLISMPGHAATRDASDKLTLNDAELGALHKAIQEAENISNQAAKIKFART